MFLSITGGSDVGAGGMRCIGDVLHTIFTAAASSPHTGLIACSHESEID
jgi:hypothetical protein